MTSHGGNLIIYGMVVHKPQAGLDVIAHGSDDSLLESETLHTFN